MKAVRAILFAGLVACAFAQPAVPASETATYKETVLYSVHGGSDGEQPVGGVIKVKSTLYGANAGGGLSEGGTAYSLDLNSGAEKVLYAFCSQQDCPDGASPNGMIDVNGMLYGTTAYGGASQFCYEIYLVGCGTVFALDQTTGTEKVLYSFCSQENCTDGGYPAAGVLKANGRLYGTTLQGGTGNYCGHGCGTVFSLDPTSGNETVLHSFCGQQACCTQKQGCTDGLYPVAGLIDLKGVLYGTTSGGGTGSSDHFCEGCGTIFSVDAKTGAEKVLYSFCTQPNCTDGAGPRSALIEMNGLLYGTTDGGGSASCSSTVACGTVFSFDPSTGVEKVLYAFCSQTNCVDGAAPNGGLVAVGGALYGTAEVGGIAGCPLLSNLGCGVVFSIDPNANAEEVLYSFCSQKNCKDGEGPTGLIAVNGKFYGTTAVGGTYNYGTVFMLKNEH